MTEVRSIAILSSKKLASVGRSDRKDGGRLRCYCYRRWPRGAEFARRLAAGGLDVRVLEASDGVGGRVRTDDCNGFQVDRGFQVLLTAYPEAQEVLARERTALKAAARSVTVNGCWAALLAFDKPLGFPFDAAFVHESALSWIACNSSKPERGGHESWVLHASPDWTDTCLEDEPDQVLPRLLDAFWTVIGALPRTPIYAASHRWRWWQPRGTPADPLPLWLVASSRCVW